MHFLLPAVFLILLTLKLAGIIFVSWWIVFLPLFIGVIFSLVVIAIYIAILIWASK